LLLSSIARALACKSNHPSTQAQNLFHKAMEVPTNEAELALLASSRLVKARKLIYPATGLNKILSWGEDFCSYRHFFVSAMTDIVDQLR